MKVICLAIDDLQKRGMSQMFICVNYAENSFCIALLHKLWQLFHNLVDLDKAWISAWYVIPPCILSMIRRERNSRCLKRNRKQCRRFRYIVSCYFAFGVNWVRRGLYFMDLLLTCTTSQHYVCVFYAYSYSPLCVISIETTLWYGLHTLYPPQTPLCGKYTRYVVVVPYSYRRLISWIGQILTTAVESNDNRMVAATKKNYRHIVVTL